MASWSHASGGPLRNVVAQIIFLESERNFEGWLAKLSRHAVIHPSSSFWLPVNMGGLAPFCSSLSARGSSCSLSISRLNIVLSRSNASIFLVNHVTCPWSISRLGGGGVGCIGIPSLSAWRPYIALLVPWSIAVVYESLVTQE